MNCWDAHVPVMNHRNAWAEERYAPRSPDAEAAASASGGPAVGAGGGASSSNPGEAARRRVVRPEEPEAAEEPDDILIVASRLKAYVRDRSDFNTSADALVALSEIVRRATDTAIRNARIEGRRTVKGRDFEG